MSANEPPEENVPPQELGPDVEEAEVDVQPFGDQQMETRQPRNQSYRYRNDLIVDIVSIDNGNAGGPDDFRPTPRMERIVMEIATRVQTLEAKLSHLTKSATTTPYNCRDS
ncbi:hypothetical protein Aduo_018406 [Ancylostoma duodenale]